MFKQTHPLWNTVYMNETHANKYTPTMNLLNYFDTKITSWEVKDCYTYHYLALFLQGKKDMWLKKVNRPLMAGYIIIYIVNIMSNYNIMMM